MISQSKNDKRKDLLAAALKLFAEYGFHGTPTSKIAKFAGVANGTLFHYYNTKEDLIVSLYIDIKMRMAEHIEAKAINRSNAKELFKEQFTEVLLWSLENKDEFYFIQQFHTSPFAALLSPEEIKKQLSKSCHQIEEAIKEKAIKDRDVNFILTLFTSHTFGLNQYFTKTKLTKKQQLETINDSFEMLWTMIS
ncbi:Fatty acid metabolism regulator protein [compost metagenome]